MTSASENRPVKPLTDEQLFDLLEHPEQWPDDPAVQAQLAEMLELHLGLKAHPDELHTALQGGHARPWWRTSWMAAAATFLVAAVPTLYAVQHAQYTRALAKDARRHDDVAQRRAQSRLWAKFLVQSSELIRDFERKPLVCQREGEFEDRSAERDLAVMLLDRSHELVTLQAPVAGAETLRNDLHAFLRELQMEDGCMAPERAEELRKLARTRNLQEEAERLARMIDKDPS